MGIRILPREHGPVQAVVDIRAYAREKPHICIPIAGENVDFGKNVGSAVCAALALIHENLLHGPPACQSVTSKLKLLAQMALVTLGQPKKQKLPPFRRLHLQLLANPKLPRKRR